MQKRFSIGGLHDETNLQKGLCATALTGCGAGSAEAVTETQSALFPRRVANPRVSEILFVKRIKQQKDS